MGKCMIEILDFLIALHEIFVGPLQLGLDIAPGCLGLFAPGNVDHDALNLRDLPRLVTHRGNIAQPDDPSIRGQHPILKAAVLFLRRQRSAQADCFLTILGMDMVLPELRVLEPPLRGVT